MPEITEIGSGVLRLRAEDKAFKGSGLTFWITLYTTTVLFRHLSEELPPSESSSLPKVPQASICFACFFLAYCDYCFISNIIYNWYDQKPHRIQQPQTQKDAELVTRRAYLTSSCRAYVYFQICSDICS